MNDRALLFAAVFFRSLATGMMGVLLGIYLAQLSFDTRTIGLMVTLGLAGAALGTAFVTFFADHVGHKRCLMLVTALSVLGALLLALGSAPWLLAVAAFVGMVNGMGRDRGAALVLEQGALPATVTDAQRTMTFARYNVLQDIGHAVGSLLAAAPGLLERGAHLDAVAAHRGSILVYGALMAIPLIAYSRLSPAIESRRVELATRVTSATRAMLVRICGLFAIDAVAGGFLTTALLSYFFYQRFDVDVASIGLLFFAARVANAFSHLGAAWLAKRIGLVRTMVYTHIPSSVLLLTVPFMPNFTTAALLFLLRESLVEMDVPTRQSYVMAVVRPEERTFASGITHLVRLAGWAFAPAFAGWLMIGASLAMPIYIGAGMKIFYDLMLWRAFRGVVPPEERRASGT
jgi:MFS family permease